MLSNAGEAKMNSSLLFCCELQHVDTPVMEYIQRHTYISSGSTLDAAESTCQEQWAIGTDGNGKTRVSMLSPWLGDDVIELHKIKRVIHRHTCICTHNL